MGGQEVESISVKDNRAGDGLQKLLSALAVEGASTQSGTNANSRIFFQIAWHFRNYFLIFIRQHHSLRHTDLQNLISAIGRMNSQQANPAPHRSLCRQNRCPHLPMTARHQQGMAISPFVAVLFAFPKKRLDSSFIV